MKIFPFLVSCLLISPAFSAYSFDVASYKGQFRTNVITPYMGAVQILAEQVIKYLADSPVPQTESASRDLHRLLDTRTEAMTDKLNISVRASHELRQKLDTAVVFMTFQVSQAQQQVYNAEKNLVNISTRITQMDSQIADAQQQVNTLDQRVRDREKDVRDEEERLRKERERCIHKRKKRCFLCKVVKGVENAAKEVNKPIQQATNFVGKHINRVVCPVINRDGINNAQNRVNQARNELNSARGTLANMQQRRRQLVSEQQNMQATRTQLQLGKQKLQTSLVTLQQVFNSTVHVNVQLKYVLEHVSTFLTRSLELSDVVKNLINMESLIIPLKAIGQTIVAYSPVPQDLIFFNNMKAIIEAKLPVVQQKVQQYELIDNTST